MKRLIVLLIVPVLIYAQHNNDALNSISKNEIFESVKFLASDSLKGRAAGTDENLIAAMFIADKFRQYGLTPMIKKDTFSKTILPVDEDAKDYSYDVEDQSFNEYFQRFYFQKTTLAGNNELFIIRNSGEAYLKKGYTFGVDFYVQYYGSSSIEAAAPVVFAGYGITEGEDGYNDYLDSTGIEVDVNNKIVIMIDGHPQQGDSSSKFSKARNPQYRNPLRKAEAALSKGAMAVVLLSSPLMNDPQIQVKYERLARAFSKSSDRLPEQPKRSLPIIYAGKNVAVDLFEGTGIKLKDHMAAIDYNLRPSAVELNNKTISYAVNVTNELVATQNVIGFLEGTDPVLKNEVIVIGAHYDHVGLGYYGSMKRENIGQIHNGADDNASGTAGIIELAEAFSKAKPRRSIVFAAFTAEENGLIGSKYYVYEQPLIPLENTVGMINLDMISRNNEKLIWIGGAFYTDDLRFVAEEANKEIGMELLYNVGLLTNASDQAPFLRRKIPALFFFAGDHEDYHTPTDDIEKINAAKAESVCKLAFLTAQIIANREQKPEFRDLPMDERAALVKESIARQKKYKK
jgi:aminopeptidase YwaD